MTGLLADEATTLEPSVPGVVELGKSSRIRRGTEENFFWLTHQSDEPSGRYGWTRREEEAIEFKPIRDQLALEVCLDMARTRNQNLPILS